MKVQSLSLMMLLCLCLGVANTQSAEDLYFDNAIYLKGSGGQYVKGNSEYSIGFFGKNLAEEMRVSPDAVVEFDRYKKKSAWSLGLSLTSLGLLVGALVADNTDVQTGLWIGAGATAIAAIPFAIQSETHLNRSIYLRNGAVLK